MYVIPELRLNNFKDVYIPSNKDLYLKCGLHNVVRAGSVGKDGEFVEPCNSLDDKLSSIENGQRQAYDLYEQHLYDEQRAAEERAKQATQSSVENHNDDVTNV